MRVVFFCVAWNYLSLTFYFPLFETESKWVSLDASIFLSQVDPEIKSRRTWSLLDCHPGFLTRVYYKLSFFNCLFSVFLFFETQSIALSLFSFFPFHFFEMTSFLDLCVVSVCYINVLYFSKEKNQLITGERKFE